MKMPKITEETEDSDHSFPDGSMDEEFLEPEDENEDELNEEEDEVVPPEDPVAKLMKQLTSSGAAIIKRVNPGEITPTKPPLTIEPALIKQHSPVVKSLNLAAIIKPGSHLASLIKPAINSNLAAIIKPAPKPSLSCITCSEDFPDSWELNEHLMIHVKMPNLILEKLASDDEEDEENQEDWSDEEDDQETEIPVKKVVNSNILQSLGMGISIKKAADPSLQVNPVPNVQIKTQVGEEGPVKQVTPTAGIPVTSASADSLANASGSLKLTIKHSTGKQDFQVVNNNHNTEIKKEPSVPGAVPVPVPVAIPRAVPVAASAALGSAPTTINSRRNSTWDSVDIKDGILEECRIKMEPNVVPSYPNTAPPFVNPLSGMASMESRIKNEVGSGPGSPASPSDSIKVKSFAFEQQEKEARQAMQLQQQQLQQPTIPKPMVIPKKEPNLGVAIIEINGDDSDNDDIMFVDSTPATIVDKKPIILQQRAQIKELPSSPIPNIKPPPMTFPPVSRPPTSTVNSNTSPHISTEKQHNFNWNAPSSKSLETMLSDKSTDAIFESLMASHRKESNSDSEYISLDTLGPQHTCEVCNTRYSDLRLLESHRRATGHSTSVVLSGAAGNKSSSLVPSSYGQGGGGGFLLNSLFPVKQLAETVGKLTTNHSSGSGFSHQQNIMVNIQSFPPQGQNFMPGQQPPGGYPGMHQQMPPGYPPGYGMPDPSQGQYSQYPPAPPYGAPGYGNYPPSHPGQPPHGSSMYNQQPPNPSGYPQVPPYNPQMPYGQNQYNPNQGQLPPNSMSGQIPVSVMDQGGHQSPNKLGGIRIQNPQSPVPGQKLQTMGVRMANPMQGPRGMMKPRGGGPPRGRGGGPRMGIRPSIRPGVQVQGQAIRGGKPNLIRTPMKRPAPPNGAPHTPTKKRLDMLLPDRHDNEDCQVMSMQQQRDGLPMIDSIKGSKEPCPNVNIGSGLTVTKTRVRPPSPLLPANKDAGTVASLLAQRGIRITAKPKSPSPPPINIPNLGSGISITKKSVSSSFVIPEESYDYSCSVCNKTFSNSAALNVHMSQMHPSAKLAKCDSCPVSYPTYQQLHEHKKLFHNSVSEMGLPVIDFSQQANLKKLTSLGIFNFIPLANREQGNGCFGIPIVSVQNAMNGTLNSSLQALGAGGLLSLGPVKPLPKC